MIRQLTEVLLGEHRLAHELRELTFDQVWEAARQRPRVIRRQAGCRTCLGLSGPVLDLAELLRGHTLTVASGLRQDVLELRQYSSTIHGDDLDSVPPMDAITILDRMSTAEEFLRRHAPAHFEESGEGLRGFVTVAKRRRARGHGYQRLRLHPRVPELVLRDRAFVARHGASPVALLEMEDAVDRTLGEFRGGLVAVVPARPRRLFEILVYFRPGATGSLMDLTGDQRWGLAQAIREITGALRLELVRRGLPEAYHWCLHGSAGLDTYVRIHAQARADAASDPRDWCQTLQSHLGLR